MYWLRTYENIELTLDHYSANFYIEDYVGPGFLNAVNRYYGYQVWR